ncbi:MAG TPA: hypothetical protein VHL77_05735, partial [Ferruginibacter sp.]|nr:hypothetical protein [Ferruginibacter sp.]
KFSTGAPQYIYINEEAANGGRFHQHRVPGTEEVISLSAPIYTPRKDGITYLQRAAELLSEKEALADIHFKTGNIFLWAGSKKQAYPYFEKSLAMVPANANARLTLIDIYKALYKNRSAMYQLNYLYDSAQINFPKRLLLSEFEIHAGHFDKARLLLDKAEVYHPYVVPEIADLRGRAYLLDEKYREAINWYRRCMDAQETDQLFTTYSIARLYARAGNRKAAWNWLQSAINMGFNYAYVLQNDPFMDNLRKTARWQTMISSIQMKKYRSNVKAN